MHFPKPKEAAESPITYAQAKRRSDKEGMFYYITYVKWGKLAEQEAPKKEVELYTLGKIIIMLPPPLPVGYRMEHHKSWAWLVSQIYNEKIAADYSDDEVDSAATDEEILSLLGIRCEIVNWELHPGYLERYGNEDTAWSDLGQSVRDLYGLAANQPNYQKGVKSERRSPPTTIEVLEKMLRLAKEQNIKS